jgi:hypothetical protein
MFEGQIGSLLVQGKSSLQLGLDENWTLLELSVLLVMQGGNSILHCCFNNASAQRIALDAIPVLVSSDLALIHMPFSRLCLIFKMVCDRRAEGTG